MAETGWEVPEPTATLVFETEPFKGAEIKVRLRLSPTMYHAITDIMERRHAPETTLVQMMDLTHEASTIFVPDGLISWNLTDGGKPVPPTVEGCDSLDTRIVSSIISTWIAWLGKAPLPLPETPPEPTALPTGQNRTQRRSTGGGRTAAGSPRKSTRSRTSSLSSVSSE